MPPESPTFVLTHPQFEALLAAARSSANRYDFALVCLLGLLGLRVFEATGAHLNDLGHEHGHRVLRVRDKGDKVVPVPVPVPLPSTVARAVDRPRGGAPPVRASQPQRRPHGPRQAGVAGILSCPAAGELRGPRAATIDPMQPPDFALTTPTA